MMITVIPMMIRSDSARVIKICHKPEDMSLFGSKLNWCRYKAEAMHVLSSTLCPIVTCVSIGPGKFESAHIVKDSFGQACAVSIVLQP